MAREEHDREDLLAEASALVQRIELTIPGWPLPVVAGVRKSGALSVYFGADPAWHFNPRGELRRAFVAGRLLKAENHRLIALMRVRTGDEVQLVRQPLSEADQQSLLSLCQDQLQQLLAAASGGHCQVLRSVPVDLPALEKLLDWLDRLPEALTPARRPHVR